MYYNGFTMSATKMILKTIENTVAF